MLDGLWDFAFDDDNFGEKNKWFDVFPGQKKILVPFSYQTKQSQINDQSEHHFIWYSTTIKNPFDLKNKRLLLNFEGVDYICKVWVNGVFVGIHQGGYTRFTFDITDKLVNNQAHIVVKAEDFKEATQPRGKQTWLKEPFGCWYHETNGIWKSVWLECVSDVYLKNVKINPSFENYNTEFEITLNRVEEDLSLQIDISYEDKLISSTSLSLLKRISNISVDMNNDFDGFRVHYWDPNNPNLYNVVYKLKKGNEVLEKIQSYFGFRQLRAEKNCILINNNPTYLKLVLYQGYHRNSGLSAPDYETMLQDLKLIKEMGFNGVRVHQKIEDERFYYLADIMGLFVWCEMPSAYEFKDETITNYVSEWMQVVTQMFNHPSIVTWVPINESWGVPRIVLDSTNQHLAETLYHVTKAYDKYRLVISNDGWEHTNSDVVTFHNYSQDANELYHFYGNLEKTLAGENFVDYSQTRLPFANGYHYHGQPVIVSEFAGIGYENGKDNGWGYGNKVSSSEQFVQRLSAMVAAIRKIDGICGFCVTQFSDVEIEINGLVDFDRKPKAKIEDLRKAISQ